MTTIKNNTNNLTVGDMPGGTVIPAVQTVPMAEVGTDPRILEEMKEKRTADTKYFRTEHHGGVIAVYPTPVHYKEDGEWKEIDNTLQKEDTEEEGYQNKNAAMKVKFARHGKSKKLVTIHKGSEKLSWGLVADGKEQPEADFRIYEETEEKMAVTGENGQKPESGFDENVQEQINDISEKEDVRNRNKKMMQTKHLRSGGIYENILDGISLEYYLEGERLKENIILRDKGAAAKPLIFRITHKKLRLEEKNGNLLFYAKKENTDNIVYYMKAPCMFEKSTGAFGEVHYELESVSDSETLLKIKADQQWLQAEERQFPVIIDPNMETTRNVQSITDTFVREKYPSSSMPGSFGSFCVGNNSSEGRCRSYLKFNTLPTLPQGAVLYDARIYICQYMFSANNGNLFYVTAHEVKEDWSDGSTTWNNQPSAGTDVLSFAQMAQVKTEGGVTMAEAKEFNVTKLVKKWYVTSEGGVVRPAANYGIMLKAMNENVLADAHFVSSNYPLNNTIGITAEMFPVGIFYYRDANGLEDYYSYHKNSVGRAGNVYVNDYNGNMVLVHGDAVTYGGKFPAAVSHVYNLSMRAVNDCHVGYGWRLSAHQELKESGIQDFPYYYMDGDGTKHYFYKDTSDGNRLKDEDGLGYVITQTSSSNDTEYRKMETKDKVVKTFHKDGRITKETDPNGNTITYTYDGEKKLVSMTDTAGGTLVFTYDTTAEKKLISIKDGANRLTSYGYDSSGNLVSISYPDQKETRYGYGTEVHALMYVKAPDTYEVDYQYRKELGMLRVVSIQERKGNTDYGHKTKIDYKDGNMTVFTEPGLDNNMDSTSDNLIHTYQFDNNGRPVCVSNQDGNAASYEYFIEGQKNNEVSGIGSAMKTINNHLLNTRFENGLDDWEIYARLINTVTVSTEDGVIGNKAVKVVRSAEERSDSGVSQTVELKPGTYTVSAYMKSTDLHCGTDGYLGIVVYGLPEGSSTGTLLAASPGIREATSTSFENGWQRESVTFTISSTYKYAQIIGTMFNATGTGYMTCFQLEEGSQASRFNLIENGSFEYVGTNGIPKTFNARETDPAGDGCNASYSKYGNRSLRIYGQPGKRKTYWKSIPITGTEKDIYTISGWAKGKAVPGKEFSIAVGFVYTDGTVKWDNIPFNPYVEDWQFISRTISADDKSSQTSKSYQAIYIHLFYGDNANDAWFDGIQLVRDDAQSFVYDDDGNLVSAKTAAEKSGFAYDKAGNLSQIMDITGTAFAYGYDDKKNLKLSVSSEDTACRFDHDQYGNATRCVVSGGSFNGAVTPGRAYYIREKISGKYLTVPGGSTNSGTGVQLFEYAGQAYQQWKVEDAGEGYVTLIPMHATGMRLDVRNGVNQDGTSIQVCGKNGLSPQEFRLKLLERGEYQIVAKCSKDIRGLTNAANLTTDGAAITLWAENDSYDRQKWYFEPADLTNSDGTARRTDDPEDGSIFAIRASHSGQYLNIGNAAPVAGNYVDQFYRNGRDWQCFRLQKANTAGDYYIRPVYAPAMALARGATYEGRSAITIQNFSAGDANQIFRFTKVKGCYAILAPGTTEGMGVMGNSWTKEAKIVTHSSALADYAPNKLFILENQGQRMESLLTYTDKGLQVQKITDARGYTTTNTFGGGAGHLLTKSTDAAGYATNYTYNTNNDLLTSVSANVGSTTVTNTYAYDEGDRLKTIGHNGFTYGFEYDAFGNRTKVTVGGNILAENTYYPGNGPLKTITYGNGHALHQQYDRDYRLSQRTFTAPGESPDASNKKISYAYDAYGYPAAQYDSINSITYKYSYDMIGRLLSMDNSRGQKLRVTYDSKNRVETLWHHVGNDKIVSGYAYGNVEDKEHPGLVYGTNVDFQRRSRLTYDRLARLKENALWLSGGKLYKTAYTYLPGQDAGQTTTLVGSITNGVGTDAEETLTYTYDSRGNIQTISEGSGSSKTVKVTYYYDALNRLIRENNVWENKTICYTYDAGGNMTYRKEYAYTTSSTLGTVRSSISYGYGDSTWKDKLTSYNGRSITYDGVGNPLTYRDMTMTWECGRRLASVQLSGKTVRYAYDADGIRIGKTVTKDSTGVVEKTVKYYLAGSRIAAVEKNGVLAQIIYDQNGRPFMLRVEDPEATSMVTEYRYKYYYYLFNAQNDVIGLIDRDGNKVVSYVYNSWGAPLTTADSSGMDIAGLNPFRYRCYCYDEETAFYYLKSRYYDPWVGRFINSDGYVSTGMGMNCCNMFIYCENNPVNRLDLEGHFWEAVWNGFVQSIEQVGGVFAAAAGISQLDGPLPGLADLAGLAIAGGALLFCAGAAAVAGIKNAAGSAKKASDKKEEKIYTVYVLKDPAGAVQYVGRTKNPGTRKNAHEANPARKNLLFVEEVSNLNYYEARGLEQTYMLYYHTINTANKMNNQINGISLKNPQLQRYLTAAEGALGYMWNQVSNEVLNWAGL